MSEFDKTFAKKFHKALITEMNKFAEKNGVSVQKVPLRYDANEMRTSITFVKPVSVSGPANYPDKQALENGSAKRGDRAMAGGKEVIILERRRVKYVFAYPENTDKRYVANFRFFTPINKGK